MRILSIDWDYFIKATSSQYTWFPDGGNENLPSALLNFIWSSCYANAEVRGENLTSIKSDDKAMDVIRKIVDRNKDRFLYAVAESHKHLGEFILDESMSEKCLEGLEIVNIDHHHDFYDIGDELNCGNWINKVVEKFPDAKVTWIKNDTSGPAPSDRLITTTDIHAADGDYDVIYVCRSGAWSPMHLDKEFGVLNRYIHKRCGFCILRQELPNRWDDEARKCVQESVTTMKAAMSAAGDNTDLIETLKAVGSALND